MHRTALPNRTDISSCIWPQGCSPDCRCVSASAHMCGACPPSDQLGRLLGYWILRCSWRDASSNPASGQHLFKLVRSCLGVQLRHGGNHVDFGNGLRFGSSTLFCILFNVSCQVRLIPSRSCGARIGRCRRLSRVQRSPSSATPAPDGFFLAHNSYRFRGLLLDDASQRAGHLLLKSCFDVRRVFLQSLAVCFFSVLCTPWCA